MPPTLYNKKTKRTNTLKRAIQNGFLEAPQDFDFDFIYDLTTKRVVSLKTAQRRIARGTPEDNFITPFSDFTPAVDMSVEGILRRHRTVNVKTGIITQGTPMKQPHTESRWMDILESPFYNAFLANLPQYLTNSMNAVGPEFDLFSYKLIIYRKLVITNDKNEDTITYDTITLKSFELNRTDDLGTIEDKVAEQYSDYIDKHPSVTMNIMIAGYYYMPENLATGEGDIKPYLESLKAYSPNVDRQYHELTYVSTTFNKICTYETFYFNHVIKDKSEWFKNKKNVHTELNKESKEIIQACNDGELVKAYTLLSEKYNTTLLVQYRGEKYYSEFKNGVHTIVDDDRYDDIYDGKLVGIYHKKHIAPAIFKSVTTKIKKAFNYVLKPTTVSKKKPTTTIYTFDIETFSVENAKGRYQLPFTICVVNMDDRNEQYNYYGENCMIDFVNWLDETSIKTNMSKSKAKCKINKRLFYAHNGGNFDFIYIYKLLYERLPSTKSIFAGNAIKTMTFYNNTFIDSYMLLTASLDNLAESFNLPIRKLPYPYTYITKDTLDKVVHINEIPLNCWNSPKDKDAYITALTRYPDLADTTPDMFNVKDYTIKYCMSDCIILADIMKKHYDNSTGTINDIEFDTVGKMTVAQECKTVFTQVFLKQDLYPSPEDIRVNERNAYKGGRTEVFKKEFTTVTIKEFKVVFNKVFNKIFKRGANTITTRIFNTEFGIEFKKEFNKEYSVNVKVMNYYDINSSYPASMTKDVPADYRKKIVLDNPRVTNKFVDTNLYEVEVEYNKNVLIPNLLYRTEKKNIIALQNIPRSYHWGIELTHAITLGAKITVYSIVYYTAKPIFKEYAEYFYNERLKAKKRGDDVASQILKLRLNNLYGIFALKPYTTKEIVQTYEDFKYLQSKKNILDWNKLDDDLTIVEYIDETFTLNIGSLVRLSSYICAASRTNLAEFMYDCGHENIYYCDTDSVFTTATPSPELLDDKILGKWKRENGTPITVAKFLAPKTYSYTTAKGETIHAKGIPKKLLETGDFDDMTVEKGLTKTINSMFLRSLNGITIIKQSRTIRPVYTKRIWNKNDSIPYNTLEAYAESR